MRSCNVYCSRIGGQRNSPVNEAPAVGGEDSHSSAALFFRKPPVASTFSFPQQLFRGSIFDSRTFSTTVRPLYHLAILSRVLDRRKRIDFRCVYTLAYPTSPQIVLHSYLPLSPMLLSIIKRSEHSTLHPITLSKGLSSKGQWQGCCSSEAQVAWVIQGTTTQASLPLTHDLSIEALSWRAYTSILSGF